MGYCIKIDFANFKPIKVLLLFTTVVPKPNQPSFQITACPANSGRLYIVFWCPFLVLFWATCPVHLCREAKKNKEYFEYKL